MTTRLTSDFSARKLRGTKLLLTFLAGTRLAFPQQTASPTAMTAVLTRISTVIDDIPKKREDLHVADSMKSDVEEMKAAFGEENAAPLPYLSMFNSTEDLLKRVASKKIKSTEISQTILDDSASLFSIIGDAVRKSPTGKVSPVRVTIKIMKGDQEIKSWEIFYMAYFLKHVRKDVGPDSFPGLSTSSLPLPHGRYLFEARDLRGGITEQKACTVEGDAPIGCELLVK